MTKKQGHFDNEVFHTEIPNDIDINIKGSEKMTKSQIADALGEKFDKEFASDAQNANMELWKVLKHI